MLHTFCLLYTLSTLLLVIPREDTRACHTPSIVFPFHEEGCRKPVLGACGLKTLRASLSDTSSKLCQNWLRHRRGTLYLRAAVHRRGQRPPKVLGTNNYDDDDDDVELHVLGCQLTY